jgi:hypothetical protein
VAGLALFSRECYLTSGAAVSLTRACCRIHCSSNAVEGLFAKLTRQRLKRGVFTSIVDLQAAINRFIAETNDKPKPFVWTKPADAILAAVQRGRQALEATH